MNFIKNIPKLSAVRKVLETLLFLALGSFETLGSKLSHGTSLKFADVRHHLRKVSNEDFVFKSKHLSLNRCQTTLNKIWGRMWTKRFKTAWLKAKKCPLPESNQQRLLRRELLYPFN